MVAAVAVVAAVAELVVAELAAGIVFLVLMPFWVLRPPRAVNHVLKSGGDARLSVAKKSRGRNSVISLYSAPDVYKEASAANMAIFR